MNFFNTKIIFKGYYGQLNTGDDAFVEVGNWGARHYWNVQDIRFLSKQDHLPITVTPSKGYPINMPKTYSLQQQLLIHNTAHFIFAGGSTFGDVPVGGIKDRVLKSKRKNEKLKIGAIGVALGPFKGIQQEKRVAEYLKYLDFVSVRDEKSFQFIDSIDLDYSPVNSFDLAALLPQIYGMKTTARPPIKPKIIGVSICNYESYIVGGDLINEKRRNEFILNLIVKMNRNFDGMFRFFIFNGNPIMGDQQLTKEIIQKSGVRNYEIVHYNRETKTSWKSIKECDIMISTRLHASIFACFADVPFFLIEYHRKCTDFIKDVGYDQKLRLFDGDTEIKEASRKILEIINNPDLYTPPTNKLEMIEKAKLNFTSIKIS